MTEGQSAMAVQEEDAKAFVSLMRLAPNGIYRRNIKMNGFVVVSSNMGVVRTEEDYIWLRFLPDRLLQASGRYKIAFRTSCRDVWI